ncbi:unnamed protein product, partial [Staurois parvus]
TEWVVSQGEGSHICFKPLPVRPLYINSRTIAVHGWVANFKWHPRPLLVRAPWERTALQSGACCVLGHIGTSIVVRDLCARFRSYMIIDWPISDHMKSSKQDVTSHIIAYYV